MQDRFDLDNPQLPDADQRCTSDHSRYRPAAAWSPPRPQFVTIAATSTVEHTPSTVVVHQSLVPTRDVAPMMLLAPWATAAGHTLPLRQTSAAKLKLIATVGVETSRVVLVLADLVDDQVPGPAQVVIKRHDT